MPRVFLLVATRRHDLSDRTVGIRLTEPTAKADAARYAAALNSDHVRVRVQPIDKPAEELTAIVRAWGTSDAAENGRRPDPAELDGWPGHWRTAYLAGFDAARQPAPR